MPHSAIGTGRSAGLLFSLPFCLLLLSHFAIDTYSAIVPAILNVLEVQFRLTTEQSAWLLGMGTLSSGLSQPIFAWIADRLNTRVFGALGLLLGAVLICSIELISSAFLLFAFYVVGMIGIGMFHPTAVSVVGQLNPIKRSAAVSWFFVFGMLGGICGSLIGPVMINKQINLMGYGLPILIPGGLILAFCLQATISNINSNGSSVTVAPCDIPKNGRKESALAVGLLYLAAACRFFVHGAIAFLFVRWIGYQTELSQSGLNQAEIAANTSIVVGRLNAMMSLGMAIGGLCSGLLIPLGKEKLPLIAIPILLCPAIAVFPQFPYATVGMGLALLIGASLAAMVPITISLAQRLMPGWTSLASGLVLGGAWSVGMFGPPVVRFVLDQYSYQTAFTLVAMTLATSGVLSMMLPGRLIRRSGHTA